MEIVYLYLPFLFSLEFKHAYISVLKEGKGRNKGKETKRKERRKKEEGTPSYNHTPVTPQPARPTHHSTKAIYTRSSKTSFLLNPIHKTWFFFDFLAAFHVVKLFCLLEALLSLGFCETPKPAVPMSGWILALRLHLPHGHSIGFCPNHSPLLILQTLRGQSQVPHGSSY